MGTAGSIIQRLFCRLWECLQVEFCIIDASATFPPLHIDYFRFLYVAVMVWAGDQQPTTQKPNLAHYFCFVILFYVIYDFK